MQFTINDGGQMGLKSAERPWSYYLVRRVEHLSIGDAQGVASLYVRDVASGDGTRDVAYLAIERDGSHTVYERTATSGCLGIPGATWTEQDLQRVLGESPLSEEEPWQPSEPEQPAAPQPMLLLTDGEGWAALYRDGQEAFEHFRGAEAAGEPPFKLAYLVLPSGSVVPTVVAAQIGAFDEDDYADASMTFTPDPRGSLLGAAAARDEAARFVVSWRVDGRA